MKNITFLLFTLISFNFCLGQVKPKLKWKDFIGTWESKEVFDSKKGLTQLSFKKQKSNADTIQTIWKFYEGDTMHIITRHLDNTADTAMVKWFYVKANNILQIRNKVSFGTYFMLKDFKFDIIEMQEDKLRIVLKQ